MFILQHSDILHNIFQLALTIQRGLYKLNGFKKPIYRYNNQTSINNFIISINTMKLFIYYILKEVYGYATVMWMIIDQGQYYKNEH